MNDNLLDRLIAWVRNENGAPGKVPTRYSEEIEIPTVLGAAEARATIRQAFVDGMAFSDALASSDSE